MRRIICTLFVSGTLLLAACVSTTPGTTSGSQTTPRTTSASQTNPSATPAATTTPVTTLPVMTTTPATTPATTPTATTTPDTSGFFPADPDPIGAFWPGGEEILAHLNADGDMDQILFEEDDLTVNGINYRDLIEDVLMNSPITDRFIIVDVDTSDDQREIGLMVMGDSDDYAVYFYALPEDQLIFLGYVPFSISEIDEQFDGRGNIMGDGRLSVLQTWFAPMTWALDESGKIEKVADQIYVPKQYDYMEQIRLNVELPIYRNRGDDTPFMDLQPQDVEFLATDDMNWVQIQGENGDAGWFKVENYDFITDLSKEAGDVFENLSSAD